MFTLMTIFNFGGPLRVVACQASALFTILSVLTNSAHAEGRVVWQQAGWQVIEVNGQQTGRVVGCKAMREYRSRTNSRDTIRFSFAKFKTSNWKGWIEGNASVGLAHKTVGLFVGGVLIHRVPRATPDAEGALELGSIQQDAVAAIQGGQDFEVAAAAWRQKFLWDGTAQAFLKVDECLHKAVADQARADHALSERGRLVRVVDTIDGGSLNMRVRPSPAAALVASVPAGQGGLEMVGGCRDADDVRALHRWCLVRWQGQEGWVSIAGLVRDVSTSLAQPPQQQKPNPPRPSSSHTHHSPPFLRGGA